MNLKKYAMWIAAAIIVAIVAKPALEYVAKVLTAVAGLLPGV